MNREQFLENVYAVLLGESAKKYIDEQGLIYEPFHDMYVAFEVKVHPLNRVLVSHRIADECGVTEEEVILHGKSNSAKHGYEFKDLGEYVGMDKTGIFVLTTPDGYKGAYAVFYADLKGLADNVGKDLIMAPSSIHEWVVVPEGAAPIEKVADMLREINDAQVAPDDRLSYTVYRYNRNTGRIEAAA